MESVYNKEVDWVPKEATLIEKALQKGVPLIGICFGAQHIAKILGGQVYKLPKPVLQLSTVRMTDAGKQHPVFDGVPSHFRAISLHQDHFTLPASCEVLAQTSAHISAYCHENVIGFQFHPELTALHLSSLLRKRVKLAFVEPNVIEDSIILQNEVLMNEQILANQASIFAKNILEFVEECMTDQIKDAIERGIPGAIAEPFTEDNHHFQVKVIAEQFAGKTLLQQHRMVYDALGSLMNEIHALGIETAIK